VVNSGGKTSEREFTNNNDNLRLGLNLDRSDRGTDVHVDPKHSFLPAELSEIGVPSLERRGSGSPYRHTARRLMIS
jgi:hypothetical protein